MNPVVKWSIVEKIYSNTKTNYCKLCLLGKLYIIDFIDDNRLLNKRNEFNEEREREREREKESGRVGQS